MFVRGKRVFAIRQPLPVPGNHPQVSRSGERRNARPVHCAQCPFAPTLMRCIHRTIVTLVLVFAGAGTVSAQTIPTTPDSTKVTTLAPVTVTTSGNWFTRSDDLRKSVIAAMEENRRLAGVI